MNPEPAGSSDLQRYHRQMLLPGIGEGGQQRLRESHALIVGCGALGTVIADALVRAGVGTLTIVDRDVVELTNLQRQVLFDEEDVRCGMPKAQAARSKLQCINSSVRVHAHVDDFTHRNAESYAAQVDIIMDGLDNFETRYILNDLAVARQLPYVYGGAVGHSGVSMLVLPHSEAADTAKGHRSIVQWSAAQATPCLRCVFPEAPPPGAMPTCETAGVLGAVVSHIGTHQALQAIKLLTGNIDAADRSLLSIDVWSNQVQRFDVSSAWMHKQCPCCGRGVFEFLRGNRDDQGGSTTLCGRNAVQITPGNIAHTIDLEAFARQLAPHGEFTCNGFLMRGTLTHERSSTGEAMELTLFSNGRAIIKGTTEVDRARSLYARYIGA